MNRILDQIAEEINGVIAKMDEQDLVNAMGGGRAQRSRLRHRRGPVRIPGARICDAHDAYQLYELHDGGNHLPLHA